MHDTDFGMLLKALGYSWAGYRKVRKGVKKRIIRHMQQIGCVNVEAYIERLGSNPVIRAECERLMTVSISRFFRDRHLWAALEKEILPESVQRVPGVFKVWSAGCACGEEAYSISILWSHLQRILSTLPALDILATDINPVYLDRAKAGIYSLSSLREVEREDLETFFRETSGRSRYRIIPAIKKAISWKSHHLLDDPPGFGFHMIFLRNNVLTYYEAPLKCTAFRNISEALAPEGYLIVGSHEQLPKTETVFKPVLPFSYLLKKIK